MIRRIPIKVHRKPIILPPHIKMQVKLWEMMEITREDDIYDISRHYDSLVMKATNKAGHTSLSLKNPTEHRNWIHFERVYEICRMKGWDANLYIEGQFERAKGWTRMKFPLPNMLYSDNALRSHINYLGDIVKKYKKDTNAEKRKRGSETKTLSTQVIRGVVRSVEMISDHLDRGKVEDKAQYKALTIFNNWEQMSPFYLWSVGWFHDIMSDMTGKKIEECKTEFTRISGSPSLQRMIEESVRETEKQLNVPHNIKF
jgi:hypothetical protein